MALQLVHFHIVSKIMAMCLLTAATNDALLTHCKQVNGRNQSLTVVMLHKKIQGAFVKKVAVTVAQAEIMRKVIQ